MPDMLVRLYNMEEEFTLYMDLKEKGIMIKRVLSPDSGYGTRIY